MSITTWLMLPAGRGVVREQEAGGRVEAERPDAASGRRREHALSSQADSLGREWNEYGRRQSERAECLFHA
jgi:hypothetical protein